VYLFMLRRWAHNFTYTDVANPHNRIDVPLAVGTPVVVEGVVDVHLGYYARNLSRRSLLRDHSFPLIYRFCLWLVTLVSLVIV